MTLKYIWRSSRLGCHFHVHFSYPWHAFASHGLPAIAELLVRSINHRISVALHTCLSEPTTKIWMKIDPYYQRQRRSPGIAASSKIRLMQIFAGVRWRGGFKWEWGRRNQLFSLILPAISSEEPSHLRSQYYNTMLCSSVVALQWQRNKWP